MIKKIIVFATVATLFCVPIGVSAASAIEAAPVNETIATASDMAEASDTGSTSDVAEMTTEVPATTDSEPETVSLTDNAPVTVSAEKVIVPELTRPGYTLLYWSDQKDGSGEKWYPGDVFETGEADTTLYAVWERTTPDTETESETTTETEEESESETETETETESESEAETETHILFDYLSYTDDGKTISDADAYRMIKELAVGDINTLTDLENAVDDLTPVRDGYRLTGFNTKPTGDGFDLADLITSVDDIDQLLNLLDQSDSAASEEEIADFIALQDSMSSTSVDNEEDPAPSLTDENTDVFVLYAIWEKEEDNDLEGLIEEEWPTIDPIPVDEGETDSTDTTDSTDEVESVDTGWEIIPDEEETSTAETQATETVAETQATEAPATEAVTEPAATTATELVGVYAEPEAQTAPSTEAVTEGY